jgi:inner membrane protein
MAVGRFYGRGAPASQSAGWAMAGFAAVSALPDADAIAFVVGIPYEDQFGHRGATHSITFAVLCGLAAFALAKWRSLHAPVQLAVLAALTSVSHPLLDMLTNGGLGCGLFWPFSVERVTFPIGPIPVAPIGLGMLSAGGLFVVAFETIMFSPFLLYATWPRRAKSAT